MVIYIFRRLVLMLPTLLGISLLTLLMIHLAPGDPVQMQVGEAMGKGTISPDEIEALRRTYYLHLPVFINPTPEDVRTVNLELALGLSSTDENKRERAVRKLEQRGAVSMAAAIEVLDRVEEKGRRSILAGLATIAARMGIEQDLQAASSPSVFWHAWLEALPKRPYRAAEQLVKQTLVRGAKDLPPSLQHLDTFALPALMEGLEQRGAEGAATPMLTETLTRLTGVDLRIRDADSLEDRVRLLEGWKRWWAPRRADYVANTGVRRLTAIITETQYAKWLGRLVTLDFDRSIRDNIPIREKLADRLKVTLNLAMLSLLISYVVAIPLGVFSAVRQYSLLDRTTTVILFMLYSLPSFWVAMLLQQYLCGVDLASLDWFPLVGMESANHAQLSWSGQSWDRIWHLILPVGVLTYRSFASLSRFQRVGMLDVIRQDYIRTARAKGLPERVVILKHALRNSVLPILTLIGMQLPFLVGGAVIVEAIFQINGMGLETLEAIRTRDMNWIMASVTLTAVMTMVGILISDVLYALVDPRIQVGSSNTG